MPSANITIEAGEAIYAKGVSRTARIAIEVNTLAGSDPAKGWADYSDSLRTTGSPQAIPANADTPVLNDGVNGVKTQEPAGINFYDAGVITGRNGDGLMITTEFKIRRASGNGDYSLEYWWDIGGAVGELYRRTFNLPGTGERNITFTTGVYTLDTWEANGATSYIRTSVETELHSVRYVIHRTHIGA